MALFTTLTDTFDTNTLPTLWPSSTGASITGGRLRVPCDTGFNNATSAASYTLDGSSVRAVVYPAAAATATVEAVSELLVLSTTPGTDAGFSYNAVTGNLSCINRVGYSDGTPTALTYNATTHRWWRLRLTSGTLYWETSPDGDTWTVRRSVAAPAWSTAGTTLAVTLAAHRNNGTNNYTEFDHLNVGPTYGTAVAGPGALSPAVTGKRTVKGVATAGAGAIPSATASGDRAVHGVAVAPLSVHPAIVGESSAASYPPPPRGARWRWLTGPRTGGVTQELTAAKGRKLTARLTAASETGFTINARLPQAATVDELQTDVHVLFTSKDAVTWQLMRGRVATRSDSGSADEHTMAISALDYRAVLDRRRLLAGIALNNNPSFTHGVWAWTGAGGLLEIDTSQSQSGGQSGRLTPDGVTATVTITSDGIAVTPGTVYRAPGWVRCATARPVRWRIDWKDGGGTVIATDDITLDVPAESFELAEIEAAAPVGAVTAELVASMTGTPAATDVLWLDDGLLTTAPNQASRLRWDQVDQGQIAWGLVDDTQQRVAGDLGISPAWTGTAPTGQLRDRLYELGDSVGERIQELSEVIDGFDWDVIPVSASALQFAVWSPERGTNRGVVLLYGGLVAEFDRSVQPSGYANNIRHSGATNLDVQERSADDLADQPAGRWDAVFGDTGLTTQAALDERAHWQMKESQVVPTTWTVKLRPGAWEGPDHIWLGDTVQLVVFSGTLAVDTTLRVFEMQFDVSDEGDAAVELTLGGPKPDRRRMPRLFDRRITNLERR